MDSCVLLAFLLFCWAEAASAPDPPLKSVRVGGAVTLPVTIPKGQSVNNLLLRDSSREIAIAIWMDSKDISVLNINYANRVAFQKDEMAFRIANLSLDDGGTYEISTSFTSPSPKVLSSFLVAIFNITERISSLENDSCYIYLQCEAGMGSSHRVTYAWKDTEAGTTLSKEAWLTQLVPTNQKRAYTCTAQSPTAQSTFSFVLQHPCIPNTASPGKRTLVAGLSPGQRTPGDCYSAAAAVTQEDPAFPAPPRYLNGASKGPDESLSWHQPFQVDQIKQPSRTLYFLETSQNKNIFIIASYIPGNQLQPPLFISWVSTPHEASPHQPTPASPGLPRAGTGGPCSASS